MDKALKIAVLLSAVDNMSKIIDQSVSKSQQRLRQLTDTMKADFAKGTAAIAAGAAVAASMTPAISAYAELENASVRLETSMMRMGGKTDELFKPVNDLAIQLGSRLPGTTADFQTLFKVMLDGGVSARSILDGVGQSAAYLSVALEMPYAEAGKFAAKMKEATGTTDSDFMALMDTIARTKQLGVEVGEMQYAFGRSAGALKLMGIQGLEASKSISVLYASLIRAGLSGETVGTGFSSILNNIINPDKFSKAQAAAAQLGVSLQFMKDGKFLGIENLIFQLDKLRQFSAEERGSVVNALTGGGQDAQMLQTLITNGIAGFEQLSGKMKDQATLNEKVEKQLGTLTNTFEAATGNFTNMMAAIGSSMGPMLKTLAAAFGEITTAVTKFAETNPEIFAFIGTLMGLGAAALIVGGLTYYLHGAWTAAKAGLILFNNATKIGTAIQWAWNAAMLANPAVWITVAIIALVAAVALLVWKWKEVTAYFEKSTGVMRFVLILFKALFSPILLVAWAIRKVIDNWDGIQAFFGMILGEVTALPSKLFEAGQKIVSSIKDGIASKWDDFKGWWGDKIQSIRDFLPFSPAKVGPLKDIHKLKFVETIAASIKPAPLVRAVRGVTAAAAMALATPSAAGVPSGAAGGGGVTITINVPVNVAPGGQGNPDDIREAVRSLLPEIEQQLRRVAERRAARSY